MYYLKKLLIILLAMPIAACSTIHTSQTKFVSYSPTIAPITVPAGIKDPTAESYYPVPVVALKQPLGTEPPLTPPGSKFNQSVNAAKK